MWPVILHMFFHVIQILNGFNGRVIRLRLCGRSPIHIRTTVRHVQVQEDTHSYCDQRRYPGHEEHNSNTKYGAEQTDPGIVILKGRTPAGRFCNGGVEDREVDEAVSGEEKV